MVFKGESYVRAGLSLRAEQVQNIRDLAKQKLEEAIRSKGKNPADYSITDILPAEDLGLPSEEWAHTFAAANTWETFVDQKVGDEKFIVIYGYTNTSSTPVTVAAKFYNGASIMKVIHLQSVYAQQEPFAYFDPAVWAEGDSMKIELYGNAAASDNPVFLGFVAVRKGERITE